MHGQWGIGQKAMAPSSNTHLYSNVDLNRFYSEKIEIVKLSLSNNSERGGGYKVFIYTPSAILQTKLNVANILPYLISSQQKVSTL